MRTLTTFEYGWTYVKIEVAQQLERVQVFVSREQPITNRRYWLAALKCHVKPTNQIASSVCTSMISKRLVNKAYSSEVKALSEK